MTVETVPFDLDSVPEPELDQISVGTMPFEVLVHGSNYRDEINYSPEALMNSLLIGNRGVVVSSMWVTPQMLENEDGELEHTGKFEVLDGNRRLRCLTLLKERAPSTVIQPIPVVTVPRYIADDPLLWLETRVKMGVSAVQLTAVERFKGIWEMAQLLIDQYLEGKIDNDRNRKHAEYQAIAELNRRFGYEEKSKVVKCAIAYHGRIPQEWRDAYDNSKFGSPYDVISVEVMYRTLQKNGYQGEPSEFIDICWAAVGDRKGDKIMERDGITAREQILAMIKQDYVRGQLSEFADAEPEAVKLLEQAVIEGDIATDTLHATIKAAKDSLTPVSLSEVLETAADLASDVTPSDEYVKITDGDLDRALKTVQTQADEVAIAQLEDDGEVEAKIQYLMAETLDYAIGILTTVTLDVETSLRLLRKQLKNRGEEKFGKMNLTEVTKIHAAVSKAGTTTERTEKQYLKRLAHELKSKPVEPVTPVRTDVQIDDIEF